MLKKILSYLPQPECIRCHRPMNMERVEAMKDFLLRARLAFVYCVECEGVRRQWGQD